MGKKQEEQVIKALCDSKEAQHNIAGLQANIQRQRCMLQAIWTILKDKFGFTDEKLMDLTDEIEMKEKPGIAVAEECPNCLRPLQENKLQCIYCGQLIDEQHRKPF